MARKALGGRLADVERMVAFFRRFETLALEQWATVHQVWADRLPGGQLPTRQTVTTNVLVWKAGRRGFDERSVARTIDGLVGAGIIELAIE